MAVTLFFRYGVKYLFFDSAEDPADPSPDAALGGTPSGRLPLSPTDCAPAFATFLFRVGIAEGFMFVASFVQ